MLHIPLWRNIFMALVKNKTGDMSLRQLTILFVVYTREGPHTFLALAREVGVPKPSLSRALDRLEILGYVKRYRDRDVDARVVYIGRTEAGQKFVEEFNRLINTVSQR